MHSNMIATILAAGAALVSASPALNKRTTGIATVYEQGGAAGSCGDVHGDGDMIAALGSPYQPGACGKRMRITNTGSPDGDVHGQGKTIEVTVVDTCQACMGTEIVDVSVGAWNALTDGSPYGRAAITWEWI